MRAWEHVKQLMNIYARIFAHMRVFVHEQVLAWSLQLAQAVNYLHQSEPQIIHRYAGLSSGRCFGVRAARDALTACNWVIV